MTKKIIFFYKFRKKKCSKISTKLNIWSRTLPRSNADNQRENGKNAFPEGLQKYTFPLFRVLAGRESAEKVIFFDPQNFF